MWHTDSRGGAGHPQPPPQTADRARGRSLNDVGSYGKRSEVFLGGGEVTLLADPGPLHLLPPQARAIWLLYFAVDRESEHHVLGPLSPPNCQHQTSEGPRKENVEEALFL